MIKTRVLDDGIRLVMEYIPYVQSASVGIWIRAGSVNENTKNKGISHLIEHMFFKGTETRSAKRIAEDADRIGSQMNAFTGKESTCYYIKTLAANLDQSVELILDMVLHSKFDKIELEKEKFVIYEEIKMIEDSAEDDIHDIVYEMVLAGTPLASPIIGTPGSLRGISQNRIKRYMADEYTKDSIVVSVAGNFEEEHIVSLFSGRFESFAVKKEKKLCPDTVHVPRYKVKVKDIEQSHICLGTRRLRLDEDRYYALAVLNNILGGGMSARLFQNIREEKGLAYSVYSSISSFVDTGVFSIYAGVSHDKVKEALEAIQEELEKLRSNGVTEEELAMAKEQLKSSYIFGQENVNGRMFSLGKNMTLLNKVYLPEEIIAGVDQVSMESIREVASLIDDCEQYSTAVITNRKINLEKWMHKS